MNVDEALSARYAARDFMPKPVDREVMKSVLKAAERTPSWANTQPWEVFVADGAALDRIRDGFTACFDKGAAPEMEVPPTANWSERATQCMRELGFDQREGEFGEAFKAFATLNHHFFNAPTVVYLCMDKVLSEWSLYDLGAYSQSLMLSATEHGLNTIPAANLVFFPKVIREELHIPENLEIVIGIAVGYADPADGVNSFRSARRPFEDVVHFSA